MVTVNWLKSTIDNHLPDKAIKFKSKTTGESSTLNEIINKAAPEFAKGSSFYVNPLLCSGHLQTAYTAINNFESVDHVYYKRRILTIENKTYTVGGDKIKYDRWDGESTVALDYVQPKSFFPDPDHEKFRPESQIADLPPRTEYLDPSLEHGILADDSKPLLIALHGLSGGSYESYIRAFLATISEDPYNFDAMVLNSRGCAKHSITSPQLYSGLWTNDLRYLINEHIRPNWPNKRIYLIGFSLGGAILANYLGQEGSSVYSGIKGATVVGTPWDFPDSAHHLRESIIGHNIYSPTMCQNLLRLLNQHYDSHLQFDTIVSEYKKNPTNYEISRLKQFDDVFTSKLFGLNNAEEYYRHASPVQRLLKVRVPVIILSSLDDPITGYRSLPVGEVKLNPYTNLITTTIGGHLGWFNFTGGRWYPGPLSRLYSELDKNWEIDNESLTEEDLPLDIDKAWKHDRIVYGML
ncbi:Alpha/Beta hydrolase protein [Scheffersomyces xylosifermentans]|uniref:Alpha/Beta hydrolase protein n=1 Tax=Scheffersomyces xylosifermentans TaxID=1304137 RepID=UPI00315CAD1E